MSPGRPRYALDRAKLRYRVARWLIRRLGYGSLLQAFEDVYG
jgi:hypothetical protein